MSLSFNLSLPQVREPSSAHARTPEDIYHFLQDTASLAQESFTVLTVTTRNHIIDRHLITLGTLNSSLVHPREVFRPALLDSAAAIILSHNHPSGDPTPSTEDLSITRRLIEAGKVLDINVLDHVIIGRPTQSSIGYLSIRESGLATFG